jgi:hypothetical protein
MERSPFIPFMPFLPGEMMSLWYTAYCAIKMFDCNFLFFSEMHGRDYW